MFFTNFFDLHPPIGSIWRQKWRYVCIVIKISQNWHFSILFLIGNIERRSYILFVQAIAQCFLKEKLKNNPFHPKNTKIAEKVYFLMSYFKFLGNWIKMRIMKKLTSISVKNDKLQLIDFQLRGPYIWPILYKVLCSKHKKY